MKKIYLAVLLIALLLTSALLIYTRGGQGGSGDPWAGSEAGQILPVQVKPAAIPDVCRVDQTINPIQDQTSKYLSTTCIVEFPDSLQVVPYCVNKTAKLGAANITLPQGTSQFLNIPKNCTVLVNDEKIYAKTIVCSGPAGSKVNITLQNSCTPPDSNLPKVVDGSCPPDFVINKYGGCEYKPSPDTPFCPANYIYDSTSQCCRDVGKFVNGISVCPQGYLAFPTSKPGVEEHTFVPAVSCIRKSSLDTTTDTRIYTVALGACNEKKPIQSDKPQPCIIDPATGACK